MAKKHKNYLKFLLPVILIVILAIAFWISYKGETIAGQATGTTLSLQSVYECKSAANGVLIKNPTKLSPRVLKENYCQDSSKALKYSCEGPKKYKSSELACTGDRWCKDGQCRSCPAGQALCGSRCVNLQDDNNNCGACGTRCDAELDCFKGLCAEEKKIFLCNIDWWPTEGGFDANPIRSEDIEQLTTAVQTKVLSNVYNGKRYYPVFEVVTPSGPGLPLPNYEGTPEPWDMVWSDRYEEAIWAIPVCGASEVIAGNDYFVYIDPRSREVTNNINGVISNIIYNYHNFNLGAPSSEDASDGAFPRLYLMYYFPVPDAGFQKEVDYLSDVILNLAQKTES